MRVVRALGLSVLVLSAACGGGGGRDAGPAVEPLGEPAASEAIAGAALRAADALIAMAGEPPGVAIGGAGAGGAAPAAPRMLCDRGGHLSATCAERSSGSTLRTVARECRLTDPASGLQIDIDGRLTITTPYVACNAGEVPLGAVRTYRFEDFTAVVRDAGGEVESFSAARFVETVLPLGTGCEAADATLDLEGAVALRQRDGIDATLRSAGLRIERRAVGLAGRCGLRLAADGDLEIEVDRARTLVDLDAFAVDVDPAAGIAAIEGGLTLACAAPVRLVTAARFQPWRGGCPRGGGLDIARADGSRGRLRFLNGGLTVDADGDGTVERAVSFCRDAGAPPCP